MRILVLLHKLGAEEKPSQISREEWTKGCEKLQCDSIAKLKELLPSLDTGFMVDDEFRNFYKVSSVCDCLESKYKWFLIYHQK